MIKSVQELDTLIDNIPAGQKGGRGNEGEKGQKGEVGVQGQKGEVGTQGR